MDRTVDIIGAGLAGCEAALQLAERGVKVRLFESKPLKKSPAHTMDGFAELVCSNSLKSDDLSTASGLLKSELRLLSCFLLEAAECCRVPAGSALAVDREKFSQTVTRLIRQHKNIEVVEKEVIEIDRERFTIVATGPLTHETLCAYLEEKLGYSLHFYDAVAPIVSAESIDMSRAFTASRYNKGAGDYINCPMSQQEYEDFYSQLISAESVQLKDFEKGEIFEGCMPIEIMAKRGKDSIRFGPMKPVGFIDVATGKRPYAVVQLRKENAAGDAYNIVGFQTNLKFKEQQRVFSLIPALKNAEFFRYGVMHRNTFVNAPKVLDSAFRCIKVPNMFIAGQLSGVEGYVESIMSGLIAAIHVYSLLNGKDTVKLPQNCLIGALCGYLERQNDNFQPMNANFGILPSLNVKVRDKKERKTEYSKKALNSLTEFKKAALVQLIL